MLFYHYNFLGSFFDLIVLSTHENSGQTDMKSTCLFPSLNLNSMKKASILIPCSNSHKLGTRYVIKRMVRYVQFYYVSI